MGSSDFVDMFRLLNFSHKFIPGDLNDLIGDIIDQDGHKMLHLMSAGRTETKDQNERRNEGETFTCTDATAIRWNSGVYLS